LPNQKLLEPLKKFHLPQLVNRPRLLSSQLIQEMIKLNQQSLIKLEELSNPKREIKFQFTTQILFHQLVLQLDLLKLLNKKMMPLKNLLPQLLANRLPEPQLNSQGQELILQHQLLKKKMIKKKQSKRLKIKQRKRRKMLLPKKRMLKKPKRSQSQRKRRRKRMITLLKEKIKPLPVMKRKLKLKLMPRLKHQKLMPLKLMLHQKLKPPKLMQLQKLTLPKLMPHQKLTLPQKLKPLQKLMQVSTQRLDFQTDSSGQLILRINNI